MDITFLGGPVPQRGIGVVAPFDFALDRELWRWVPDDVSLHLTRTPFVPVEVTPDMARMVSECDTLRMAVRALTAIRPGAVTYACASGSFIAGPAGERAICAAMSEAGSVPATTTAGGLIDALSELGVRKVAVMTPYTKSLTDALEDYLAQGGMTVTGRSYLGLTREIWHVRHQQIAEMARGGVAAGAGALFISCTNLHTYEVIPQLEAELRIPVLSANQVTMWTALRSIGVAAVGPYQALLDPVARTGLGLPGTRREPGGAEPRCLPAPPVAEPPEWILEEGSVLGEGPVMEEGPVSDERSVVREEAVLAEGESLTEARSVGEGGEPKECGSRRQGETLAETEALREGEALREDGRFGTEPL